MSAFLNFRTLAAVTAVTAVAGLAGVASANLVLDPGFEVANGAPDASGGDVTTVGNPPWQGFNPYVPPYGGFYSASQHLTGAQSGKSFGNPNGGIFQNGIAVAPGVTYEASSYFFNFSGDAVTNPDSTEDVRLTFYDASGTQLGDGVVSAPFVPAGNTDVWTLRGVQGTAPAGAATAQVLLFLSNPAGGGAIFVDDVSLEAVPAVPEPASLALLAAGGLLALRRRR